jgi:hypothetical protein
MLSSHPRHSSNLVNQQATSLQLMSLYKQGALSHVVHIFHMESQGDDARPVPVTIIALLEEFKDVFGEPEGLPPRRACDHHILLMPGVQPVNIRPYRHRQR